MATSFHRVNNNAASVLASAIDDNDLALSVSSGDGAEFDSVLQYLTIGRDETYAGEVVEASSRSTDAFTLAARAQDGTTATAHDAGVRVECLLVAAHITEIQDAINGIENGTTTLAKVVASGSAASTLTVDDSGTNTAVSVLELYHTSSGTPASGLGAKLLLGAEDSAGNKEAAVEIHGILTTVTNTSEQGKFLLRVKNAGSFMDALEITVASNTVTIGSNQTTVNLWNSTATTVNAFGAAPAINLGTNGIGACVVAIGDTATSGNRNLLIRSSGNSSANGNVTFADGGTNKWGIYHTFGTDTLKIYSYTNGADLVTFGTSNIGIGSASTQTLTMAARLLVRSVTDAGPMTATAGTQREIVFNTSDSKYYGCTATGSPATWAALN